MKNRIVFLPVDERFCTRDYFLLLAKAAGLNVVTPDKRLLGMKKTAPDIQRLHEWIINNVRGDDILIASVDMIVHGGLIPSRMSLESDQTLNKRLEILDYLKSIGTKIYAGVCVTRAPFYNSAEEEPDYWQYYGQDIYNISRELVKFYENQASASELAQSIAKVPSWISEDFFIRRNRNFRFVSRVIDYVKKGTIDFLNLTLDDNTQGSLSLWESEKHQKKAGDLGILSKVSIHAGADESTLTLLAKVLCDEFKVSPKFKVVYTEPEYKNFIPAYEGRPLEQGIKSHILSAGGLLCDDSEDITFYAHNPTNRKESNEQEYIESDRYTATVDVLKKSESIVGIACIKYTNGSDNSMAKAVLNASLNWNFFNFAGWNTAGNTIGTVCACSIIQYFGKKGLLKIDSYEMLKLQFVFFLEHWAFQSNVRIDLIKKANDEKGVPPWSVIPIEKWAVDFTKNELKSYADFIAQGIGFVYGDFDIFFPWHRSFELGVAVKKAKN